MIIIQLQQIIHKCDLQAPNVKPLSQQNSTPTHAHIKRNYMTVI